MLSSKGKPVRMRRMGGEFVPQFAVERGAALLSAMILTLIITLGMSTIFFRHQLDAQRFFHAADFDQGILFILGAEAWASAVLAEDAKRDAEENRGDSYSEAWATRLETVEIEGGELSACLWDLQARYNLNNLLNYTQAQWARELNEATLPETANTQLLAYMGLLNQVGVADSRRLGAILIDWLDPDIELISQDSAEDVDYLLETPPRLSANRDLVQTSELYSLNAYQDSTIELLDPYLTALPTPSTVNVNTAPPKLLLSMAGQYASLTSTDAEVNIPIEPFDTMNEFYNDAGGVLGGIGVDEKRRIFPSTMFGVSSHYFELTGQFSFNNQMFEFSSIIVRDTANQKANVLARMYNAVPDINSEETIATSLRCPRGVEVISE